MSDTTPPPIKIIGIGSRGCKAVMNIFSTELKAVEFVVCHTDAPFLSKSNIPAKVQLGTEESLEEIDKILATTKMVFIIVGIGDRVSMEAVPIIAKACKEKEILIAVIAIIPAKYENDITTEGILLLESYADTLFMINIDKLRSQLTQLRRQKIMTKANDMFVMILRMFNDLLLGINKGQINVDFADMRVVMRKGGKGILGSATCSGENRALQAIKEALAFPFWTDRSMEGADWVLLNICSSSGAHEFSMDEIDIIQGELMSQMGEKTDVILGINYDESLGDKLNVTIITTGLKYPSIETSNIDKSNRRFTERIEKLRRLSFEMNPGNYNNEIENVPAYIRRNPQLYNAVPFGEIQDIAISFDRKKINSRYSLNE